ncbi:hypothetical protein [Actinoplanes sp. GCM10030250]|uniref:hypothetical protein n=1 Tax=Actinoplanes sp. GCM10030250 TaxID=3273376 RepID=UPI003616CB70
MTKSAPKLLPAELDPGATSAIRKATLAAAGLGVPGLFHPGIDETGMAAIWTSMVTVVARRSGATVSPATITKLVTSALASVAAYTLGSKILTWLALPLIAAFPVAGVPAVVALNSTLNALFTYRLGRDCAQRFSRPGFTARDALDVGRHLVGLPTVTELADLRDVLRGA